MLSVTLLRNFWMSSSLESAAFLMVIFGYDEFVIFSSFFRYELGKLKDLFR